MLKLYVVVVIALLGSVHASTILNEEDDSEFVNLEPSIAAKDGQQTQSSGSAAAAGQMRHARVYEIYHRLGGGAWSKRGELTVASDSFSRKRVVVFSQEGATPPFQPSVDHAELYTVSLLSKQEQGSESGSGDQQQQHQGGRGSSSVASDIASRGITASVKACLLARSGFSDVFSLVESASFHLLALNYSPKGIGLECKEPGQKAASAKEARFTSVGLIAGPTEGPRPAIEPVLEMEKEEKEKAEQPGFFRKYWLYAIIAVVVLNVLFAPPEEPVKK